MALPVSQIFKDAQSADANYPAARVQLVLGNYASASGYGSTAAASGSDGSGDYPASGAIDGDRTEINVGPASGADNDAGRSSWRSATAPSSVPQTLDVTLSQSRTLNRLKLYHLSGHGLKSFKFSYWNGASYVDFASTVDLGLGITFTTAGTLDTVDFPDVSTTKVRLTVYDTQVVSDKANVVELELYRLIDITSRTKGVAVKRQRNYKLADPLAAMVQLQLANDDRFFSISHVPTAAETTSGFVNQELRPELGVIISLGFFTPVQELVQVFAGTVDRISAESGSRSATIECRDGMKRLINKIEYTKLKTSADISACIQYILNRGNISNYEMSLDSTGINIDYFFVDGVDELTGIRDLTQAAADAAFYFSESGVATFRSYAGQTPLQHVYTSEGDWEAGTRVNIDTTSIPGDMIVDYTSSDAQQVVDWYDSNGVGGSPLTTWTTHVSSLSNAWQNGAPSTGIQILDNTSDGAKQWAYRSMARGSGIWELSIQPDTFGGALYTIDWFFSVQNIGGPDNFYNGYKLSIQHTGSAAATLRLVRCDVGGNTTVASTNITLLAASSSPTNLFKITRYPTGRTVVLFNGAQVIDATDSTYTVALYTALQTSCTHFTVQVNFGRLKQGIVPSTSLVGTWTSPVLDTGASTVAFGAITASQILSSGTITYYTRSSPDGSTWTSYAAVSVSGQIQSPVDRYLQTQVVMNTNGLIGNPDILDITVNWTSGGGSSKYPATASFMFSFDSTLLNVRQELADNLGGGTSLYNNVSVQAQPLVLTGANSDVQFQGSVGTPPTNISSGTPLSITNGQTITVAPYIAGGMDTSRMSGADPTALAVTFASSGAGSWVCTSIHPTRPVFVISVTHDGTITNLQVQGKKFQAATYIQVQTALDAASISFYGNRQFSVSNTWIVSAATALSIAEAIVGNFKDPLSYIPACAVRPTFSAQVGDRITIVDQNMDLTADYQAVEVAHAYAVNGDAGDVKTDMTLIKIPV